MGQRLGAEGRFCLSWGDPREGASVKGSIGVPMGMEPITNKKLRQLRARMKYKKSKTENHKPILGLKDTSPQTQPILVKKK